MCTLKKKYKNGLIVTTSALMGAAVLFPTVTVLAAPAVQNGWTSSQGKWYYYKNGTKVVNEWKSDSNGWCYLGADGAMVKSTFQADPHGLCFIGADGYWSGTSAWRQDSTTKAWYFIGVDGYAVKNTWQKDSNGWCYLGADGIGVSNDWVKDSHGWCYINSNGYWNGQAPISTGNNQELNDGTTHTGIYLISDLGTFGSVDALKPTIINGNVTIDCTNALATDTINLNNLTINGKLTVNLGAGSLKLANVKVNKMDISNVGSHSADLTGNTTIGTLTVDDQNNDAHIVVDGNANIHNTVIHSGAALEVAGSAINANPFGNVTVSPTAAPSQNNRVSFAGAFTNSSITVTAPSNIIVAQGTVLNTITANSNLTVSGQGTVDNITVGRGAAQLSLWLPTVGTVLVSSQAPGARVNIPAGTSVTTLNINAAASITGTGAITNANIGANGTIIETIPTNTSLVSGVTANVGGQVADSSNTNVIPSMPGVPVDPTEPGIPGGGAITTPTLEVNFVGDLSGVSITKVSDKKFKANISNIASSKMMNQVNLTSDVYNNITSISINGASQDVDIAFSDNSASIKISDLLGDLDPKHDGISIGALRAYCGKTATLIVTIDNTDISVVVTL